MAFDDPSRPIAAGIFVDSHNTLYLYGLGDGQVHRSGPVYLRQRQACGR